MMTSPEDLGAGVFNSKGELVGLVSVTIPRVGACFMELSTTLQSALDAARQPAAKKD